MDVLEFLKRTNNRNLKTRLSYLVNEALEASEDELNERRKKLKELREFEDFLYQKELENLLKIDAMENTEKRMKWIENAKFEKKEADRKLLEMKKAQQEMENSQEMREIQTRNLLLETKRAQLHQIEKKEEIRKKEKEFDQMWFEIGKDFDREKEKQEIYERNLQKIITNQTQATLSNQMAERKQLKTEKVAAKIKEEQLAEEFARQTEIQDERCELDLQKRKKLQMANALMSQIEEKKIAKQMKNEIERKFFKKLEEQDLLKLLRANEDQLKEKKNNWEELNNSMQYAEKQKHEKSAKEKMVDAALTVKGHSLDKNLKLEKEVKIPYRKSVR